MNKSRQKIFHAVAAAGITLVSSPVVAEPPPGTSAGNFNEKAIQHWTLKGPPGATPQRVSEQLPLADQPNRGGWVTFEPMCDEFEAPKLDTSKWVVGMPDDKDLPSTFHVEYVRAWTLKDTQPETPAP